MLKLIRFEPRIIPNMQMVHDWNLGSINIDNSICPTKEINKNSKVHISTGEYAYVSSPWLDGEKTPIVLLDKTFFTRHRYNLKEGFPTIRISSSKYDLQFIDAIAKPTHLRLVSSTMKGVGTLNVEHSLYGRLVFNNILCTYRPEIEQDTLLVPDHLWDFLIYNNLWMD